MHLCNQVCSVSNIGVVPCTELGPSRRTVNVQSVHANPLKRDTSLLTPEGSKFTNSGREIEMSEPKKLIGEPKEVTNLTRVTPNKY